MDKKQQEWKKKWFFAKSINLVIIYNLLDYVNITTITNCRLT